MEALSRWPSPQSSLLTLPAALRQPLRQLGQALMLSARALGRLLAGIAAHADYLVAGRGRVLSPLESNPP